MLLYENEEELSNHHHGHPVVDEIRELIVKLFDMGFTKLSTILSRKRQ